MDQANRDWVQRALATLPPRRRVVEIGSLYVNGQVRDLFTQAKSYVGVDIRPGNGVDVVADAAIWRPKKPVDTVVCIAVLEHAPEAEAICRATWEMLEHGGVLFLSAPTVGYPAHSWTGAAPEPGEFYRNPTEADLREWLSDYAELRFEVNNGQAMVAGFKACE